MWDLRDYARIRVEGKILGLRHEGNYVSVEWEEYERQQKSLSYRKHPNSFTLTTYFSSSFSLFCKNLSWSDMLTKSTDENFLQVNLSFEAYIYVFLLDQDHLAVGQDLTVEADLRHETELVEFFTRVRERKEEKKVG